MFTRSALMFAIALVLTTNALAQRCPSKLEVVLSDGSRVCLAHYPIAEEVATGTVGALHRHVPGGGVYSIAATPLSTQCKRSIGIDSCHFTASQTALCPESSLRNDNAIRNCKRGLAGESSTPDCDCRMIVDEGRSRLTKDEFERFAGKQAN